MHIQLMWDEPFENVVQWNFEGAFGVIDYMPPMNDSIGRAMVEPDARHDVVLNMGGAIPLPNRPFRYLVQAINGAPPNLKLVACASTNPLTRAVIANTLGREPSLNGRFALLPSYDDACHLIQQSRQGDTT